MAASPPPDAKLNRRLLVLFALPAIAFAMPTIPVYVYLPAFYADTLGLGLTTVGIVLLAARIIDVVTDPLIGFLSDHWQSRWGRRKPWILAGALVAAVALVLLLQPPVSASPLYLAVTAIVLYVGWTAVAVPYAAWAAELSPDYHERSRITGWREAATIGGVLLAGAVPAVVTGVGGSEGDGLAAIAWLAVTLGLPAVALLLLRVPEVRHHSLPRLHRRFDTEALTTLFRNGPFVRLIAAWFVNGLANGVPAVLFPLYLEYGLGADAEERAALIFTYFISGVVAIPVWLRLSRSFGKQRTWCVAMALAIAAFMLVPLLDRGDLIAFAVICIVTGTALGADLTLPPAMQADVIDWDRLKFGRDRAGIFFALWSMATKLALAIAVGVAFPVLDWVGFETGGENSSIALLALVVIYALVPSVLKVVPIVLVWTHPITAKRQHAIRRRLVRREGGNGAEGKT